MITYDEAENKINGMLERCAELIDVYEKVILKATEKLKEERKRHKGLEKLRIELEKEKDQPLKQKTTHQ